MYTKQHRRTRRKDVDSKFVQDRKRKSGEKAKADKQSLGSNCNTPHEPSSLVLKVDKT